MKTIRSSDIGNYLYCRRAWWFCKEGYESANQVELSSGTELHRKHGRKVMAAGLFNSVGCVVMLIAIVLLVVYLVSNLPG